MGSVLQAGSQSHTFHNRATRWLTHSGAQCSTYDTIPTSCFIPPLCTISSSVPARDAQPDKHHGTRIIPLSTGSWGGRVLHSVTVWLVLTWDMDSNGIERCGRVEFDGYWRRSQRKRCRALSPCRIIQRSSYRKHTQVPISQYRSSRGTLQISCTSSLSSRHVWSRRLWGAACSTYQRMVTGWFYWRYWPSQMRVVHL